MYECYVTNSIQLPLHTVINVGKHLPNLFPLEIVRSTEEIKGVFSRYELVSKPE